MKRIVFLAALVFALVFPTFGMSAAVAPVTSVTHSFNVDENGLVGETVEYEVNEEYVRQFGSVNNEFIEAYVAQIIKNDVPPNRSQTLRAASPAVAANYSSIKETNTIYQGIQVSCFCSACGKRVALSYTGMETVSGITYYVYRGTCYH